MADCDEFIRKWVTIYGQCQLLFTGGGQVTNVINLMEIETGRTCGDKMGML